MLFVVVAEVDQCFFFFGSKMVKFNCLTSHNIIQLNSFYSSSFLSTDAPLSHSDGYENI